VRAVRIYRNGEIASGRGSGPEEVTNGAAYAAETGSPGEGRIIVTLPDGTVLTLIGAIQLVLGVSDGIGPEAPLPG